MSAALLIFVAFNALRFVLLTVVVTVALATDDPARRRTALAVLRVLRPLASVPDALKKLPPSSSAG